MCEPIRLQEILYPVLVMARTDSFENNNVLATKLYFHTLQPLATPSIYNYYLKNMDFSGLNAQNLNCNRQKRPPVVFAIKEW